MVLKVYTTTNCPDCRVVKSYLSAMGAEFKEVKVNKPEIVKHIEEKTGQRKVPLIENGKGFVVGFEPDKIKKLISRM